jgi:type III secretion protein L
VTAPLPRPRGRVLRAAELAAWTDAVGIRAAAIAEAAAIRAAAHEEGRAAGAATAAALLAETEARIDAALAALEPRLVATVLQLVARVLDDFDRPELVARLAARAVAEQRAARSILVRVPSGTEQAVEAHLTGLPGARLLRVQVDPALAPADCVVETEHGVAHAGLAAQLAALEQGLRAAYAVPA